MNLHIALLVAAFVVFVIDALWNRGTGGPWWGGRLSSVGFALATLSFLVR